MLESTTEGHRERLEAFRLDPFGGSRHQTLGVSAVLPLGSDAPFLERCLTPLLRTVERVIVVDHRTTAERSVPGEAARAVSIASALGLADRLGTVDYPFELSPPGRDHLRTAPDSVHSLVHFHNWAFSHVRTTYAIRWDASLALTPSGESLLAALNWQVGHHHVALRLPRHPLYVESDRVAYLDLAWPNVEHRGHPVIPGFSYVKGFDRALLRLPEHTRSYGLPHGSCLMLRDLSAPPEPTTAPDGPSSAETRRERYEADTIRAIRAGRWEERRDLHRIEAPAGTHVIDHAATYWTAS